MKLHKWVYIACLAAGMFQSGVTMAEPAGRVAVYIPEQYYDHDIKLWQFYYGYWFKQGEALEQPALETIKSTFANTDVCRSGDAADVIVALKPHMFYNPHMTTYYGDVTANVFSGSGKPLATYRSEVESQGFLDVKPAEKIQSVYREAMQKIVQQMQADQSVMGLAQKGLSDNETKMPCQMVSILKAK